MPILYIYTAIVLPVNRDDDNVWEFFIERAAIMEFDAGKRRHDAEFYALARTRLYFDPLGVSMPRIGYFAPFWNTDFGWSDVDGKPVVFPHAAVLAEMAVVAFDEARRADRPHSILSAWRSRLGA